MAVDFGVGLLGPAASRSASEAAELLPGALLGSFSASASRAGGGVGTWGITAPRPASSGAVQGLPGTAPEPDRSASDAAGPAAAWKESTAAPPTFLALALLLFERPALGASLPCSSSASAAALPAAPSGASSGCASPASPSSAAILRLGAGLPEAPLKPLPRNAPTKTCGARVGQAGGLSADCPGTEVDHLWLGTRSHRASQRGWVDDFGPVAAGLCAAPRLALQRRRGGSRTVDCQLRDSAPERLI